MVNNKNGRAAFKRFLPAFPSPNFAHIKQSIARRFSRSGSNRLRSVVGRPPTPYAGRSENDLSVIDTDSVYEQSYEMQTGLRQPFKGSSETLFERAQNFPVEVVRACETSSSAHDPAGPSRGLQSASSQTVGGVENPRHYPRLRHPLRIPQRLSGTRHGQDASPTQASSSGSQRPTLTSLYQEGQHNGQYPPQPWSGSGINTIDTEESPNQDPDVPPAQHPFDGPQLHPNTLSSAGYEFYNWYHWRQDEDDELEASDDAADVTSPPSEEVLSDWRELREAAKVNRLDRNGRCVSDSDGNVFPSAAVLSMIT